VVAKIAELEQEIADRAGLTAVLVREELRRICALDPALLYDEHGMLRPIDKLPAGVRACIAAIDYETVEQTGEDGQLVVVRVPSRLRFWNKNQALEVAARITGLLKDAKLAVDVNPLTELLERIGGNGSGLPYNAKR
jgi:hypothetical protein